MARRQIAFSAVAAMMVIAAAGCGSGDAEQSAPPPPQRTGGAKPVNNIATGPVPEALKRKYNPPGSPGAARRNMATGAGSGRSSDTEPRKYD